MWTVSRGIYTLMLMLCAGISICCYHIRLSNMPKERRTHSKSRASPFPCSSSSYRRHSSSSSSSRNPPESSVAAAKDIKEWEEVRCPVCMEHPHNAVLLLCTSHNQGCRPFMCDTSYRHSNCLDQYRKTFSGSGTTHDNAEHRQPSELVCPLCRGGVTGLTVVGPARMYMDAKARSCSLESCGFNGAYGELRKHARKDHPSVRPSEADPERQRDWRRMEQQRDIGDLFSTMQSAIGGEEGGEAARVIDEDEELGGMLRLPPLMLLLVLRVSLPGGAGTGRSFVRFSRGSSRGSSRSRRTRSAILWGETYSEVESTGRVGGEEDDNLDDEDGGSEEAPPPPLQGQGGRRPRRRLRISDDEDDGDGGEDGGDGLS